MERYCRVCNKEILRDGDVGTFYVGKEWCECQKESGAICGDGMCPYVPCAKYPKCNHVEKVFFEKDNVKISNLKEDVV